MCPFNFLTFLFPEKYIPLFYAINTIVNVGLIGLTTYTYLKKSIFLNQKLQQTGTVEKWASFLSNAFSIFSLFCANYMHCVMWADAIVLMPLGCFRAWIVIFIRKSELDLALLGWLNLSPDSTITISA